ncbi:MAG: DUF4139 domain-containing protein [Planctomycetota bacterium]|nr:DUF4139 domain-containing protein [Planctomycetota bacterium]
MLPIRKVVLYKHGVGYFERQGKVEGEATVELHFKAAEMNDVLKSITLLDLNGGRISSVSYESTQPIQKQLENIALDLPAENALTGLLNQLKGARVRLEAGAEKLEGAVMGLEQIVRKDHTTVLTAKYLCLLVAGQGLRMVDVLEIKNLALLDESVRKDLAHLLEVLIDAKKKDLKKLTIFAKGEGAREIVAGYLVETPVWKTSYRVLLREQKSRIQGWALVDNTQEEDWDDVELTLVAGLPVSFVHDLYSPRYKRRPVVEVKEEEAYAPPQLEEGVASMAALAYAPEDRERGVARAAPMAGAGAPGTAMHKKARGRAMMDETRLAAAEASMPVQTRTAEAGDLFQYEIANAVTVKRSQSALVPILNDDFDGRKVAVYNPEVREKKSHVGGALQEHHRPDAGRRPADGPRRGRVRRRVDAGDAQARRRAHPAVQRGTRLPDRH